MAKMTLDDLVSQLRAAFGAELRAVVLYGSAASGEHVPKKSDYNVLVVVDSLAADRLNAASAAARAWSDAGNPPPLTLTTDEWAASSDIFPMEYADILERHKVLHGTLPTGATVDAADLRLQLERESMGALLQLRRRALAAGGDNKAQLALMVESVSTILVIYRAVLRLNNEAPASDSTRVTERVAAIAAIDVAPVLRVIQHKRDHAAIPNADVPQVLAGYLAAQQRLVAYLDRFRRA